MIRNRPVVTDDVLRYQERGHEQIVPVGTYGFMRKLLQFKGAMSRVQEGLLSRETIQMRVDPDALLNLVPIDLVASQAVQIAFSSSQEKFFHLTNPTPPITSEFLFLLFEELGMKQPLLVENRENFSWIDKKLDQGITFYGSYLVGSKTFDRKNTDAVVKERPAESFQLDTPTLLACLLGTKPQRLTGGQ